MKLDLNNRRTFVGASEAPAACGLDPYLTPRELWVLKTHEHEALPENEAMRLGTALEPVLVSMVAKKYDVLMMPGDQHAGANGILVAQPDALAILDPAGLRLGIVEAKTTGVTEGWGDAALGAQSIPPRVLVQVAAQFYCIPKAEIAWVPVLLGKFGLRMHIHEVTRETLDSRGIIAGVARGVEKFWQHVLDGCPPTGDTPPREDILRRIKRVAGKTVTLTAEAVKTLIALKTSSEKRLVWEKIEKSLRSKLIDSIGDADQGNSEQAIVTYREVTYHKKAQPASDVKFRKLSIKWKDQQHDRDSSDATRTDTADSA